MRLCTLTMLVLAIPARAAETVDVARAVEQAKGMTRAMVAWDAGKIVDASFPRLVELMGGREKMLEQTQKAMKALKDQGVTIKSYTLGKPGEPVADGKSAYLVIPTTMDLESEGTRVITESYLLGITTDAGKSWAFVDGAGLHQQAAREHLFGRLPAGLKLPERKNPTVIPGPKKDPDPDDDKD